MTLRSVVLCASIAAVGTFALTYSVAQEREKYAERAPATDAASPPAADPWAALANLERRLQALESQPARVAPPDLAARRRYHRAATR